MNYQHIPAGTKAQAIRKVIASKHPKLELGTIAANMGITYQDLRVIIDQAGYPDSSKMRVAAADLELQEDIDVAGGPDVDEQIETATDDQPIRAHEIELVDGYHECFSCGYRGRQMPPLPCPGPATQPNLEEGRLTKIRVGDLHVDPENPRDLPKVTDPDIEELADSMTEAGLLQPIVARRSSTDGLLYVVAGHRRLVAAQRLKWTTVATIIRGPMPSDQVLAAMLIENGQRKDLDPIEEARGLARLKAQGDLSDAQVARKVGRTQVHVSGRLALLALSAEDQQAIRAGEMKLVEAVAKGRMNSGKIREKGIGRNWFLGPDHGLAQHAKARCLRLGHPRGRTVGGMACGECWESVIRADERQHLHEVSARLGECVSCGQPVEKAQELEGATA